MPAVWGKLVAVCDFNWQQPAAMATIVAAIVAIFSLAWDLRKTRVQSARELRWKKGELARTLVHDAFARPEIRAAEEMIFWRKSTHALRDGTSVMLDVEGVRAALPVASPPGGFEPAQRFARQCLFELFDLYADLEHGMDAGHLEFVDLEYKLRSHARYLREWKLELETMLSHPAVGTPLALAFLERFEKDWG